MTNSLPSWDLARRLYGTESPPRVTCEQVSVAGGVRHVVIVYSTADMTRAEHISDDGWTSTQHHTLTPRPDQGQVSRRRVERWRVARVGAVEVRHMTGADDYAGVYCTSCRRVTERRVIMRRALACTHRPPEE